MFKLVGRMLLAFATAATIGVGVSGPASAAPVSETVTVAAPVAEPRLVDVDFDRRRGFDRVSFRFRGGIPDDVSARLVRVVRDRDGDRVRLDGRVFLLLRFEEASARGFDRDEIEADLRNVLAVRLVDDGRRDDVVRVAIGLRRFDGVRVSEQGNRLIFDVRR